MSETNSIRFEADIADVVAKTKELLQLNNAQVAALNNYMQTSRKITGVLDEQNQVTGNLVTTIKAQLSETQRLDAQFKRTTSGIEIVSAKIVQLSVAEVEATKAAKLRTQADYEAEKAAKARVKAVDEVLRAEKRANDQAAKMASVRNQQARVSVLDQTVRNMTTAERSRLQGLGTDLGIPSQGKLTVMAREIAEVGVKAGLTAIQLQKLFAQVSSGSFSQIESKYAGVVASIQRYNQILAAEHGKLANKVSPSKPAGGFPSPDDSHLAKLGQYANILTRVQSTLTNLAIYRGFNFVTNQLEDSISAARNYQTQVALIRTISQDANLSTAQWTKGLKNVSNVLAIDFKDAATAAYNAVSAQIVQGQSVFKYVEDVGQLARTTGASITSSGEAISGVLNSYQMSAADAETVSAKLFRTVDLGNVVIQDVAGNIGRVAALGNDLGVSFDEILASLSTFTRNGVKTADAMTFLNNVMTKLLAPTEAMKATLKGIGIESASAAIKAQGFQNVMKKLIDEVQAGRVDGADLFPEIRGEKGFALLRQNFSEFDRDLNEIRNKSFGYYQKAKDIIAETDADAINRTMTVFKNVLTTSVGDSFNRLVAGLVGVKAKGEDIVQLTERLEQGVSKLIRGIATGAITLATFTIGMRTAAVITELVTVAKLKQAAAVSADTAAKIRNTQVTLAASAAETRYAAAAGSGRLGAFVGANPVIAAGVTVATLIAGYQAWKSTAIDTYNAVGAAGDEFFKRLREKETNKELERSLTIIEKMKEEFQGMTKILGDTLQKNIADNNKGLEKIRDRIRESKDALKVAFVGSLNEAKDALSKIQQKLTDIDNIFKNQGKNNAAYRESIAESIYGTQNKYANPDQQLGLITQRFEQTRDKINRLVAEGTPESIQEAEKLFDRLTQLSTQYYEKQGDMQNELFQQATKEAIARGEIEPGKYTFFYDDTQQRQSGNELIEFRNQLEAKGNQLLEERKRLLEEQRRTEQQDIEQKELRIKKFEEFSVVDKQGKFKDEYLNTQGKLDTNKVIADYNATIEGLKKDVGPDVLKRLELNKAFQERGELLKEELSRTVAGDNLARSQKNLGLAIDEGNQAISRGAKELTAYNQAQSQTIEQLRVLTELIKGTAAVAPEQLFQGRRSKERRLFGISREDVLTAGTRGPGEENVERFNKIKMASDELVETLKKLDKQRITVAGQSIIDPEAVKGSISQLKVLKSQLQLALQDDIKSNNLNVDPLDVKLPGQGGNTLRDIMVGIDELEEETAKADKIKSGAVGAIIQAQNNLAVLEKQTQGVSTLAAMQDNALKGLVGSFGAVTRDRIAELDKLAQKVAEFNRTAGGGPNPYSGPKEEIAPGVYGWTVPDGRAYGGPVYRAYGGPIGQDNIPIWASDGEFVMNAGATRRFYSQISSMNNQSRTPQYFNGGGEVNNFGGVTFHISDSPNPQVTARTVARLLKRAGRQGSI